MKKIARNLGLVVLMIALAAGIYYCFRMMAERNMGENATLVREMLKGINL